MLDVKIFARQIEEAAEEQIYNLAASPIGENAHIRIMPDAHAGKGCVIGTTMLVKDKICPNIVGVDIGCGVIAAKIDRPLTADELLFLREHLVDGAIPSGSAIHKEARVWDSFFELGVATLRKLRCKEIYDNREFDYFAKSMGTLGGGNHFIEIDEDSDGNHWIVVHTGSRNLGLQVAKYYQNRAEMRILEEYTYKRDTAIATLKKESRQCEISEALASIKKDAPSEFDYLVDDDYNSYLRDMALCQKWAKYNRANIIYNIAAILNRKVIMTIESVHNYIDFSTQTPILRKGAISAKYDEICLIPLNMRDGTLLCRGKGNSDWNLSAPHGAGRLMSRAQARKELSLDEFEKSMDGIVSNVCAETIDEAPFAYKNWKEIEEAVRPTVEIIDHWKPIFNFKAMS